MSKVHLLAGQGEVQGEVAANRTVCPGHHALGSLGKCAGGLIHYSFLLKL